MPDDANAAHQTKLVHGGRMLTSIMPATSVPLPLSISAGTLTIPELPNATKLIALETSSATRLAELAIFEHNLEEAEAASVLLESMFVGRAEGHVSNDPVERVLWAGLTVAYCRSFGETGLQAQEIFKNSVGGLVAHEYLFALRSKHYAHDVNLHRQSLIGAALDSSGTVIALVKNQSLAVRDLADLRNAKALIAQTKSYVQSEMRRLEAIIDGDLASMTPAQRLALPEPVYQPPTPGNVRQHRRQGRKT